MSSKRWFSSSSSILKDSNGGKRVKDVADLRALLWYIRDYNEMRDDVLNYVSEAGLQQLKKSVDTHLFESTANLLQINPKIIRGPINRLATS